MNRATNSTEHEVGSYSVLLSIDIVNQLGQHRSAITGKVRCKNDEVNYSSKQSKGERFTRDHAFKERTVTNSVIRNELEAAHNVAFFSKPI